MNKRQKIVQEAFLDNEEAVIRKLKSVYSQSLKDITKKSEELQKSIDSMTLATLQGDMDEEAKKQLQSMIQSKVYQKQYQDALKKQVNSILDNMQVEEFKTVSEYLNKCYEESFLGTMYDLHGQGIPFCFPLDQEAMVRAVQLDSKISNGLYSRLGEDVALLKRKITAQVSRGISTGMLFQQVAKGLSEYTNIGFNNAVRIARTEGHRIQVQSGMDTCYKAKEKGADVVKQWDAALDKRTRPSHQRVDGEIKELDEPFSNGLMYPGDPSGGAAEVVNCRCALLQRARWALDADELKTLQERAEYYGLDKADSFEDFKKKYLIGAKTEEWLENIGENSTIVSGAISGARNPFSNEAKEHAERYYGLVRSMKTDVARISRNTGISEKEVRSVKDFIFNEKHDLGGSELEYFEPDYMMAESWQRLIDGKPEHHDIILLQHEIMEKELMSKGMTQEEAHIEASKKYNYSKEAGKYYAKIEKHKKK